MTLFFALVMVNFTPLGSFLRPLLPSFFLHLSFVTEPLLLWEEDMDSTAYLLRYEKKKRR